MLHRLFFILLLFGIIAFAVWSFVVIGTLPSIVLLLSIFFVFQAAFTLFWMLYAWENPHDADRHRSPDTFESPRFSFSILVPARCEENVIADTLLAMDRLTYPSGMCEIVVLVRESDSKTISAIRAVYPRLRNHIVRTVTFSSDPVNKPHALNVGLSYARGSIVGVFDAEDEPHHDILNVVNTLLVRDNPDVIQSGVQLMNYNSRWFSFLNVLEYFLWFKSGLLFFSSVGKTTPLGGNTVFFKKSWLERVGGWDEGCLTEDAEIGIRMSVFGAVTRVVYDSKHTTREETPNSISDFVRQRTRWNQGFLQVVMKGKWLKLPSLKSKCFAFYILFSPYFQALLIFVSPLLVYFSLTEKMPIVITLISIFPLYLFIIQVIVQLVASWEFVREYGLKYGFFTPIKIILTFLPYQILLFISSFRATFRYMFEKNEWEKTLHENLHRSEIKLKTHYEFT